MDKIDQLWPGWEIVRAIGQGSFGAVYEIRRNLYGRIETAALKVISIPQSMQEVQELRSDGYDDESITAHFQSYLEEIIREYTVMLDLKGHTNVVYCDDVRYVQHDDGIGWDVFIKMELLTPLTGQLSKGYDGQQVIRMGIDLCNALILCKNENIIHRDIKPQNIFVSKTGDYKLGDFGVAKISDKTVSGTKIGTYKYMAPEVYLNRPYGTSSDLYSLGLVLYWAMNERRTPFLPLPPQMPKPSEEETARQRRFSGEPVPAPMHGSRDLQEIVLKACAYDPKDRFRDPAQMREALIRLSSGAQPRYDREPAEEGTVGAFGTRTAPVREKQPEDGTVGVFGNQSRPQPEQPVREDGTVGVFGNVPRQPEPAKEDPTAGVQPRQEEKPGKTLSMEELSELMSPYFGGNVKFGTAEQKKPEPVKQTPPVQKPVEPPKVQEEPPKNNKKKIIGIAVAAVAVLAVLLIVIISTTGASQDTGDSLQLTRQTMTNPISVYGNGMAAVRNDGTVVYAGTDEVIAEEVGLWTDIASVYCMTYSTLWTSDTASQFLVGLRSDGTVTYTGANGKFDTSEISGWTDIVDLAVGNEHIVGLKSDGTVVAVGDNLLKQCDVSDWTDIVDVEIGTGIGGTCTLGLKSDGTVVATGRNLYNNLDVEDWTDIVAISADNACSVGLQTNGTLVAATTVDRGPLYSGYYGEYLPKYDKWKNIVAIDVNGKRMVGVTVDGTVLETTDDVLTNGLTGPREIDFHGVDGITGVAAAVTSEDSTLLLTNSGEVRYFGTNELLETAFLEKAHLFTDIALPRSVYDGVNRNEAHGSGTGEAWEGNILANFTENLETVTKDSPAFGNEAIPRGEVIAVFFLDSLRKLDEYGFNGCWDVSRKQDGSVMAGAMQEPDGTYQIYIAADGGINGSLACKGLFQSFTRLEAVSFEQAFHTDYTTDMSNMFYGCNNLILVDCENLVTSDVTTMENMFNCCTDLAEVNVSGFDTSKVKNMSFMFHLCVSLSREVIESAFCYWNVSAVTDYEGFADSSSYTGDYLEFFEAMTAQ